MTVKIEPSLDGATIITQPMVRNFSTAGSHGPGDTIIEGDARIVTKKWQGFPPVNLTMIGKPQAPLREVVEPRYRGTAEFSTRVRLPDMLHAKFVRNPYPRAAIRRLDTSAAEKMPGVHHILTYRNALKTVPLQVELALQGEIVAIVAAETENQAEDAAEAIVVDYLDLPSVPSLAIAESGHAPDLREGKGNLLQIPEKSPNHDPAARGRWHHGDIEKGFAESDSVHEHTYYFGGGRIVPMQPFTGVASWDGDKLTFWGHGQDIYPSRDALAGWLGIDASKVHFINKWNGGTFGGYGVRSTPFWGLIAHIARVTGRPVKASLTKAEELYHISHKPETVSKFKVGLTKDGRIHALRYELHMIAGLMDVPPAHVINEVSKNQVELYTARVPHWEQLSYAYKSNTPMIGCNRSCTQQEVKWAFENLADELAEAANLDPVEFRLRNVARPGDKLDPATDWHEEMKKPELENGALTYDCFASVEVLEEGAKAFGWDKRNPKPGSMPGRFKRGMGLGISQHHPGSLSYHEDEPAFKTEREASSWRAPTSMITLTGRVILRSAIARQRHQSRHRHGGADRRDARHQRYRHHQADVGRFRDRAANRSMGGGTHLHGAGRRRAGGGEEAARRADQAGIGQARHRRRRSRAQGQRGALEVRSAALGRGRRLGRRQIVEHAGPCARRAGPLARQGRRRLLRRGRGRHLDRSVPGDARGLFARRRQGDQSVHRAERHGGPALHAGASRSPPTRSLLRSGNSRDRCTTASRLRRSRFLTIERSFDDISQIFIESLEPRWFYGYKGFSETSIGSVPGAIGNAIYNATGVR